MDELVRNITPFIRYPSLVIGSICLVIGLVSYIRSDNDKNRASLLQRHCDNLSHDLKLLSEKWKA
jgi:hypothetical protein